MDSDDADLGAVVGAVGAGGSVAVRAMWHMGPVAIRFAAQNPDLVSHLVLESTAATGAELASIRSLRVLRMLIEEDWNYYVRVASRVNLQLEGKTARMAEQAMHEGLSQEVLAAQWDAADRYDAADWLDQVQQPTLLVQRTSLPEDAGSYAAMQVLAATIPNSTMIRAGDDEADRTTIDFIGDDSSPPGGAFRTVMFTDLVGSTEMTERMGDHAVQEVLAIHDHVVREALAVHNGVEVKHTGDGIMAAFASAEDAVRAAGAIAGVLATRGVPTKIGLNAGEPVGRDGDFFGTSVNLAARVCDAATAGQVLATRVVHDITAGKGLTWSPAPPVDAKGFGEPITVFALDVE